MATKFNIGDVVLPTNRAPKNIVKNARFYQPRRIVDMQVEYLYNRERLTYTISGREGEIFLADELRLVRKSK